ncbi:hypothetical protein [Chitinilyticum aquatile]|uniref:hypothetical protein n=1 Tax=Chitinilyticum aquatile TaxID=362520 RepID=UPI000415802E|nr:hypothetical protein [Chitinilyticum aquatile]
MIEAGQQGALVTLVERKTGLTRTKQRGRRRHQSHLPHAGAAEGSGEEHHLRQWQGIRQPRDERPAVKADCYIADAYSWWQRGSNENTNGLIRQYFPKKTSFTTVKPRQIADVVRKRNNRLRKRLGFKSLNLVFEQARSLN